MIAPFPDLCLIEPFYKSDHSIVTLSIDLNECKRGPGYFKLNNSLILDTEYHQHNKENVNNIANTNTLWEIIKGTIRNETIKYASAKKQYHPQVEDAHIKDIEILENKLTRPREQQHTESLKQELDNKRK